MNISGVKELETTTIENYYLTLLSFKEIKENELKELNKNK